MSSMCADQPEGGQTRSLGETGTGIVDAKVEKDEQFAFEPVDR